MIKDQVEELIEESYLLSLSETEIRNYLRNFLESCEVVLSQMIGVHDDVRVIGIKVALLKVKLLLSEWSHYGIRTPDANSRSESDRSKLNIKFLVRQVMDIRILIFNLLDRVNPKLKEAVIREAESRKHINNTPMKRFKRKNVFNRNNLIIAGYYSLLLITLLILAVFIYY